MQKKNTFNIRRKPSFKLPFTHLFKREVFRGAGVREEDIQPPRLLFHRREESVETH